MECEECENGVPEIVDLGARRNARMRECKNDKQRERNEKTGNKTWTKKTETKGKTKGQTWENGVKVET